MAENFETKEKKEKADADEAEVSEKEHTSDPAGETDGQETKEPASDANEEKDDLTGVTDDEENANAADDGEADEKKSFFKKKKDKRDEQIEELSDRVKRQMAEFENFRKRSEKEKSQMYDMGAKGILEKILPVVDNFERGLSGLDEESEDPFADGMRMVYKQLIGALEEAGVTPIEAVGATFDPEYHNAVMHVDDEAYGENEIVEEMQKGYLYHDSVVRHSMVKVAN